MNLSQKIEAILFFKGEPTSTKRLSEITGAKEEEVVRALDELDNSLNGRGIVLMRNGDAVTLSTSPEMSFLIETMVKDEMHRDLGKAGLETLSIVIYLGPVSRSRIDYIRGVNSQFILRNLLIRGLVEKIDNPKDKRTFLYQPTFELLSHLGVKKIEDLPDYEKIKQEIENKEAVEEKEELENGTQEGGKDEPAGQ